jgi:peptide methionine sulfoxide reductase MsrA
MMNKGEGYGTRKATGGSDMYYLSKWIKELEGKIKDKQAEIDKKDRQIAELEKWAVDNFNWAICPLEDFDKAMELHRKYYPENYKGILDEKTKEPDKQAVTR